MFNLSYSGFEIHCYSHGDVILHNTVAKAGDGLGLVLRKIIRVVLAILQ